MDRADHSGAGSRHQTLCRASARDRWHFAKDVDPNAAQPRTRWSGTTQSASGRAAKSGILSHKVGTNRDRAATRALSLVGEAFGGTPSKSRASESERSESVGYLSRA